MARSLKTVALLCLVLTFSGCTTIGRMLEGQNSDRERGGGYCQVPQRDADGKMRVPYRDWSDGPERVW